MGKHYILRFSTSLLSSFLTQLRTSCPVMVLSTVAWALPQLSLEMPHRLTPEYLTKASSQLRFLILEKASFYQVDKNKPGQVITVERMWFGFVLLFSGKQNLARQIKQKHVSVELNYYYEGSGNVSLRMVPAS